MSSHHYVDHFNEFCRFRVQMLNIFNYRAVDFLNDSLQALEKLAEFPPIPGGLMFRIVTLAPSAFNDFQGWEITAVRIVEMALWEFSGCVSAWSDQKESINPLSIHGWRNEVLHREDHRFTASDGSRLMMSW